MAIPQSLTDARTALKSSREDTARKLFARFTAQQDLDAASRQFAPGSTELTNAQQAFDSAAANLVTARSNESTARSTLNGAIASWLTDPNTGKPLTPDADFVRMDHVGAPVALFPLRLETRFDVVAKTLHVRVYPDEFFCDVHERELTPDEQDAGAAYWDGIDPPDDTSPDHADVCLPRWATLAERYGVPRAAYIVRATIPGATLAPSRATAPSRGAEAVLPDRWVVLAYKNGDLRQARTGLPIPEPIDMTANPSADDQTMVEVADGFTVPSNILWTMRYDEALAKGMAIDIDNLATDEVASGFDRVVVLGVKTSLDPADASNLIADLFDAHHFARGLDLVPLGTATNNVPGQPTPFTTKDPAAAESFGFERRGPFGEPTFTPDFAILSDIFSYDSLKGPFTFLRHAANWQRDIFTGQSMRRVVWPATLGYFMRQMMNSPQFLNGQAGATPIFDEATIQRAKDFFLKYVSAQGPAPAFRVGAVPYGLVPAISHSRMQAQTGEDAGAIEVIRKLVGFWRNAVPSVPSVPRNSADRNTDLMKVISQKSGSEGVFVRNSIGPDTMTNLFQLILQDVGALYTALSRLPNGVLGTLGHTEWAAARVFQMTFASAIARYAGPLVTAHPEQGMLVSAVANPTQPIDSLNYLALLGDMRLTLGLVSDQESMPNSTPTNELIPLLYLIARHSLLLEMIEVGRSSSVLASAFAPIKQLDPELWNISPGQTNIFTVLSSIPSGSKHSVFQIIQSNYDDASHEIDPSMRLYYFSAALQRLSSLPVAELERVFTETLDLAAHRLDAYVTALATRRLSTYRDSEFQAEHAPTTYLGAYGVVEDVRPVTRTTRPIPGLGTVDVQADNGGYVHAPSLRHATAAAILRSGRMAEKSDPTKYAIELPSERARRARLLVDGVRDGQPLGELLGFELESGLRVRAVAGTEGFILALRQLYPLVANKSGLDPGLPADGIAATNVVDGQLVRQAAASTAGIPFGTKGLPAKGSAGQQAITAEIARLNEIVDAIGDLEMSEAIFQIASGDVTSAEAAMNFLPDGSNPPASEVTSSPTAGIAVSHRVALLLEGSASPQAPGWTLGASPRGSADPFVEAWVGSLLGNPSGATAHLTYHLGGGVSGDVTATDHISFADVETIGPLDFLALAQSTSVSGQGSPLDRRLAAALEAKHPGATSIAVTGYDTPVSGPSIPQLVELGRALGAVLGGARELAAADLVLTPDDVQDSDLAALAASLSFKAGNAVQDLSDALNALDTADARTALLGASAYQAEAFPDPSGPDADLAALVLSAKGDLARRLTDAQAALPASGASNAQTISSAVTVLRIVFGRNTLVVLPAAVPPGAGELAQSLTALDRSLNIGDPSTVDPHQAPGRFLQQASRVREPLGAWRRFGLYAGAFGAAPPRMSVAQLPFAAGEDWAGHSAPAASRTSLLFVSASGQTALPDPTTVWRGLLLDQWTELVPGNTAETGLAFHYDSQNSEAPQVILMGMHSGQPGGWGLTELQAIVTDTMDLAQIRPVDSDWVALGQLVPAICLASNSLNQVVSTNIGPDAIQFPPTVIL